MEDKNFGECNNDENQNELILSIKREIEDDNSYQEDLQTILNCTKQIRDNDQYLLRTEVKEEPDLEEAMCQLDQSLQKLTKYGDDSGFSDLFNVNSSNSSSSSKLPEDSLKTSNFNRTESMILSHERNGSKTTSNEILKANPKKTFSIQNGEPSTRGCSYCNYVAPNKDELAKHRILNHTKSMKRKCKLCDFVTNSAFKLKSHMNEHSIEEKSIVFKCQYCSYETMQCGHLKRHINSVHTKTTEHPCQFCDFVTTDFASMRRHIEEKHEKIVICGGVDSKNMPKIEYLGNPFKKDEKEEFTRKARIAGNERFQCQYCDYKTPFYDYLNIHINSRHTKNVLYKCKYCDYQATKLYTLRCHENSKHTKKILYRCELCNLETTRSNILKRHIQRVHVKKSFKCEYCDYVAKKEGHIRNHGRRKHGKEIKISGEIKEVGESTDIQSIR